MTSQDKDDDFAGMLQRVRNASAIGPAEPHAPRARAEPPPQKKQAESPLVSWLGLIAIAVVLVSGIIGLASLSTWIARRMVAQGASSDNPALRRQQLQRQRLRRYVVPTDSSISPSEAGRLLHAIGSAGFDGALRRWEQEPEPKFGASCCPSMTRDVSRAFGAQGNWVSNVFPAARRGLTAVQRSYLRKLAQNASLEAYRRVARASGADIGSAVWSVPQDSQVSWGELPIVRGTGLRAATNAAIAASALALADGRAASAELRLREVISVGFLLQSSARSPLEAATAGWLVNTGRVGLVALYLALGHADDAALVSARSDPPIAPSFANRRVRVAELETVLERRIRDTTELTGIRWQLLLGPYTYLPCTSVRQALFGPSARYRAALTEFQASLTSYPSDERRLAMHVRGVPQMIDPWVGFRQRNSERPAWADLAFALTRSRQLERCATLFRR